MSQIHNQPSVETEQPETPAGAAAAAAAAPAPAPARPPSPPAPVLHDEKDTIRSLIGGANGKSYGKMRAKKEAEEKRKALDALLNSEGRYRKYSIEDIEIATDCFSVARKIGEVDGYGSVYKCELDHTPVAIKVLSHHAIQGESQFLREVQLLSNIRDPNVGHLLGTCPEYGVLVYECLENGNLEDRLILRRGAGDNVSRPSVVLSWQTRFRIAAEIATALLFLHQTEPEPVVHRDLKPANIFLDRNFVSKLCNVGSTASTLCYVDPEYQQTGILGVKSDVYSLGVLLLQLITARQPMGLIHRVERAIEEGTFEEMLDPLVPDWPVEETLSLGKMALKCSELRRRDRPDLGNVVVPELNRLKAFADEKNMPPT